MPIYRHVTLIFLATCKGKSEIFGPWKITRYLEILLNLWDFFNVFVCFYSILRREEYIKGEFKNGHAHGYGEGFFEHGHYKGGFKVNKFHGKGKLVYKGNVYDGEFNNIVINPGGGVDTGFKKC